MIAIGRAAYATTCRDGIPTTRKAEPIPDLLDRLEAKDRKPTGLAWGQRPEFTPEQLAAAGYKVRLPACKRGTPEQIVATYTAGASLAATARAHGRSKESVREILVKAGVAIRGGTTSGGGPDKYVELHHDGWSTAQIAERYEVTPQTVTRALRDAGIHKRPRRGSS